MEISPGVGRAVMQIGETMPNLLKAMEENIKQQERLITVMGKLFETVEPQSKAGDIKLQISLRAEEWEELAAALDTRAAQVEEMPEALDMTQEQIKTWARTLRSAYIKVTEVLARNSMVY
jgi:hypothetical protein